MRVWHRLPVLRGIAQRGRSSTDLRVRVEGVEVAIRENRALEADLEARLSQLERKLVGVIRARLDAVSPKELP